MKFHVLAAASIALALAVNACSGAATAVPTAPPASAATAVSAAPTDIPTIAPSPTAVPSPTVALSPTTVIPPTAAPTNTAVAQAASGPAVGTGILGQMGAAMIAATSYRATITSVNPGTGQATTAVMEVVKPDRIHLTTSLGTGRTVEMIGIGQDSYMNLNGTWTKSATPLPLGSTLASNPQTIGAQIAASQKDGTVTMGGLSQVNGAPCQEYVWTPLPTAATKGGTICVDLKSGLLLQVKSTDGKTTIVFSDWNAPISIVAPL